MRVPGLVKTALARIALAGIGLVVLVEVLILRLGQDENLLPIAGLIVAVALFALRAAFGTHRHPTTGQSPAEDRMRSLELWRGRTEILVSWAEGTRGDWDKHLRPQLALEFELATGHRYANDPAAHGESGRMVFGPDLWPWVDPNRATRAERDRPGPGRQVLAEILERLEQL